MLSLRVVYILLLLLPAMIMAGCQHIGLTDSNPFFIGRYTRYISGNIPDQYVGLENPFPASMENISEGKKLYQMQCLLCHGASGEGDGPANKQLVPHPANLAITRKLPIATDAFFFWTLSEGGKLLGTAMPAFGDRLSDKEIWQVTHYINRDIDLREE